MENKYIKIKELIMWFFLIGHLLFISIGVLARILHFTHWQPILSSGIICLAISWLFVFLEIFINDIYHKNYWLLSMFFLPTISPAFYMMRRKKILGCNAFDYNKIEL
jgi:hypothetical protein